MKGINGARRERFHCSIVFRNVCIKIIGNEHAIFRGYFVIGVDGYNLEDLS